MFFYCICRSPEVCFDYSSDLDGYHHSGFLREFPEAFEQSHEVRRNKPRDFGHFNLYNTHLAARILIASSQTNFICPQFWQQIFDDNFAPGLPCSASLFRLHPTSCPVYQKLPITLRAPHGACEVRVANVMTSCCWFFLRITRYKCLQCSIPNFFDFLALSRCILPSGI